jgi:hypothetical protein
MVMVTMPGFQSFCFDEYYDCQQTQDWSFRGYDMMIDKCVEQDAEESRLQNMYEETSSKACSNTDLERALRPVMVQNVFALHPACATVHLPCQSFD